MLMYVYMTVTLVFVLCRTVKAKDGEVVLVGQSIVMYRTIGFKEIIFPQIVENARHCDFSADGLYMVIASTSSINIYTFQKINDNYQFQKIPLTNYKAPV